MTRLALSNVQVRSNLLAFDTYQEEVPRHCTVWELKDVNSRIPMDVLAQLPEARREEWRETLFWPLPTPPLAHDWTEELATAVPAALDAVEVRPAEEDAFELLVVVRQLYALRTDEGGRAEAEAWHERLVRVLGRDEFRLTRDMIDDRLTAVLGRRLVGPPTPIPPTPVATPVVSLSPPLPSVPPPPLPEPPPAEPPPKPKRRKVPLKPLVQLLLPDPPPPPPEPAVPAAAVTAPVVDADLELLNSRWDRLPDHVRKSIVLLVKAAEHLPE